MADRSSAPTPPRPLVAALQPEARGRLDRALRTSAAVLGGLGAGGALLVLAELHVDGPAGFAIRAGVIVALAALLGLTVARLRTRIEITQAIRRGQDAMGQGIVLIDPPTLRVVHATPAAAALFGRSPAEFRGFDLHDAVAPEDRRMLDERNRLRAAGHRVPARVSLPILRPDGEQCVIEWATTPLTVAGCSLLLSIVRDVTQAELAKRRLAEEHAFLEAVLDTAAGPIAVIARDGRLLRVNPAAAAFAGRPGGQLVGRTPWDAGLISAEEAAEVAAALHAGRDPYHLLVARGGRAVSWTATAMRDGAVVCVGIDVTEQRAAEARTERAYAALDLRSTELERSNRDLERFAQLLSQDLREAVQAVSGFTELLDAHAGTDLDARAAGYLTAARKASADMARLLDGISAYTRLGHGEALASNVDCEQTLDAVLRELAGEMATRGAEVTHDPLPVVPGDPEELRTLLAQLVANAIRGGDRVHVGAQRRGLGWQLTVSDDGDGVPEDDRQDLFQLSGAGVGLALCRRIVERHGGTIWIDEAAGGGSAFHVALPDREAR
jgi:PAS domain S-box-containing protein